MSDDFEEGLAGDGLVTAGEFLQGLIGIGIPFAAQDGLDGFSHDSLVFFEVFLHGGAVEQEFSQSPEGRLYGDQGVGKGDPDEPGHRGIGEVALKP